MESAIRFLAMPTHSLINQQFKVYLAGWMEARLKGYEGTGTCVLFTEKTA